MCLASVQACNMTRDAVDEVTGYKMVSWECIPAEAGTSLSTPRVGRLLNCTQPFI